MFRLSGIAELSSWFARLIMLPGTIATPPATNPTNKLRPLDFTFTSEGT